MEDISFESRMQIKNPDLVQLYSSATPNGVKVAAALEEIKILRETKEDFDYEPHTVNIRGNETRQENFRQISPTGKIPVICDPHGPSDKPFYLFESGAILMYLAEKFHELLPDAASDPAARAETMKWLFWGSTTISPQFKLFGFYYKYCPHDLPYCVARYSKECIRLLSILEHQLQSHGKDWIIGDLYTIADICIWPWINALFENYGDAPTAIFNEFKAFPNVVAWYDRCIKRPASMKSLEVTPFVFDK